MTRSIIRRVDWTCSPEPQSPDPIHVFVCLAEGCGEQGTASTDFEEARDFTFRHVGRHPSHTGYREIVTRHWRMTGEDVGPRSGATPCRGCGGRGVRVLPTSSAETECSDCDGTGHARLVEPAPSAPTREYGAPALPIVLGPVDSGAPELTERP